MRGRRIVDLTPMGRLGNVEDLVGVGDLVRLGRLSLRHRHHDAS